VNLKKAVGNSKSAVTLDIRDVRILHNYFLPYLSKLNFLSKKFKDFSDLKTICRVVYNGGHKDKTIRELLVKLSQSMNDFRLSNYKGKIPKQVLSMDELSILENTLPMSEHLLDGRVRDIATDNIDHNNESSVYLIAMPDKDLIAKSLREASEIVGVHYSTLSQKLSASGTAEVNSHLISRIGTFGVTK